MQKLLSYRKWLPVIWAGIAACIVALDYYSGPDIAFSYLFLVPVALAARYNGRWRGLAFAIALPLSRPCFHPLWESSWNWLDIFSNVVIRILVLAVAAILIDLVTRQAKEIRVLKGILPICGFCKRIRTPTQQWEQMETCITKHSEAKFSHIFCPECGEKYYTNSNFDPGDSHIPPSKIQIFCSLFDRRQNPESPDPGIREIIGTTLQKSSPSASMFNSTHNLPTRPAAAHI